MSMSFKGWLSMWMEPVSGRVMDRRVDARVDFPEPCVVLALAFLSFI